MSPPNPNGGNCRRRNLIAWGVAAAGGLVLRRLPTAAASSDASTAAAPLIGKPIPSSGQMLPVIGLGGRDFRAGELPDLRAVIGRMLELGGSIIDTAAAYGAGQSERVIGQVLTALGARSRVFLATKLTGTPERWFGGRGRGEQAGHNRGGESATETPAPSGADNVRYARDSFERSLELLQTDHLDLLQVHNLVGVGAAWPLLTELKQSGKVRYLGITTSSPDDHERMVELMRRYPVDFVEVDYSIGNRNAARNVLPAALEQKVAVMVDVPLGGAGRGGFSLASVQSKPLPAFAADLGVRDWPQLLLKYAVSHPAVTCAIPGTTKVSHLEDDQAAGRGRLLDAAMQRELERYWDRVNARPGSA